MLSDGGELVEADTYTYKYNSDGSLNKIVVTNGRSVEYSLKYRYNERDLIETLEYSFYEDGDQGTVYNYRYDSNDRLILIWLGDTDVYVDQFISYDDHDRVSYRENRFETDEDTNGVTYAYTYTTATVDYTTQTGSRVATMSADGVTYAYTYDANGNITQISIGGVVYNKYTYEGLGQLVFRRETFLNAPDFVKSGEWFGGGGTACKQIIISQRVYRFITENKLDSSLVFAPIALF